MKVKKNIIIFGLLGCTVLSLSSLWFIKYWQPKRISLWSSDIAKGKANNRLPAQFGETDLPLVEDFFDYNSFHHFISYRLNLDLHSDAKDKDQERAKLALDKTTHGLFKKKNKSETLEAFASPNLVPNFISSFLDEMDLAGVRKGNFQIDLEFYPRNHPSVLFNREARAVNLWDLNQTKSLAAAIGEKAIPVVIPKDDEYKLIRKVVTTDYPSEGQYYQYQGGVISLQLGLDKLDWSPEDLMSEKAEQLDGDLIYRRYFKIVHEDEFAFILDHTDMTIKNSAIVKFNDDVPVFFTVDVSKEFNGHNLKTPRNTLTIHLGEMLPTKKRKRGFLQRVFGSDAKTSLSTGELRLYGRLGKGEGGVDFEVKVHTLVYNLETKTFDANNSKITVELKNELLDGYTKASATNDIKRILLGPLGGNLTKSLSLGRFHPALRIQGVGR